MSSVLFIGFGASDPDLEGIISRVAAFDGRSKRHWMLVPEGKFPLLKAKRFWKDYGINVIQYDPDPAHSGVVRFLRKLATPPSLAPTLPEDQDRVKSFESRRTIETVEKQSAGISLKTQKMLWGRAASRCAFPDCRRELVMDASQTDDESVAGDACHIVAKNRSGPRGDSSLTPEQRDQYDNLILLCKVHHKLIDDQPNTYTVQRLLEMKAAHEKWVRESLS